MLWELLVDIWQWLLMVKSDFKRLLEIRRELKKKKHTENYLIGHEYPWLLEMREIQRELAKFTPYSWTLLIPGDEILFPLFVYMFPNMLPKYL